MAKNIVGKTIAKTVVAVIILIAIIYAVLSLIIPQHMATMYYNLGAYSAAARYASLRYTYTGNIEDLDRCANYAILSGKDKNVITFCGELLDDEDFDSYCSTKEESEDYRQHIYASIASSYYSTGDTETALEYAETALKSIDYFPVNNAAGILTVKVAEAKDGSTAAILYSFIQTWTTEKQYVPEDHALDESGEATGEDTYYSAVMSVLLDCKGGTDL
ncbi:MAG: hypothetical protein LUE27_00835 [Clostridia bacterium]|nr:hypothetical protein [Clostridia bacterium]